MKTLNVKQGSSEWIQARLGLPTASEFEELVTPKWEVKAGLGPTSYLYRKLAEKIMGFAINDASSFAMEQGSIAEHEARPFYEFVYETPIQTVGFITTDDGRIGCSPDGLIGDDNGIEIKCPQPHTHLQYLLEGGVPKAYLAQVHGAMLVTGRPRWTFLSYSRQFPPLIVEVKRDEKIQAVLNEALEEFLERFDAKLAVIAAMKAKENARRQAEYDKLPQDAR